MSWSCGACSSDNPDGTAFCGHCGAASPSGVSAGAADPLRGLVVTEPAVDGRRLRSERRLVTALFADISGFSELSARMDAEELVEVIDPVVSALSSVVGRFGGVVEKYAGDAILALFGAPVAHDDDAARALRTAEAMHRELAALVPELGPDAASLRLHIGVNSGHGIGRLLGSDVRLDYGVLGDVVVLAQRLEAAAPMGETFVGETTYELTRKQFELEPLGELMVKGKTEPVRAWRLVSARETSAASHFFGPTTRLAGREEELASLGSLVERLGDGHGGVGFVVGEAGAGKTVLCSAVRSHAEKEGVQWLAARCVSYGGELAYWPFADLLRRVFGLADASQTNALALLEAQLAEVALSEALPFVAALCGVEGAAVELDAHSFQVRLHESVAALFRALVSQEPTVLHIDDLHWADGPTAALLRRVLGLCSELPLLVLASTRPEALPVIADLETAGPEVPVRIELEPLAKGAVREIATGILGAPPSNALVEELLERTHGNPFFVEEVTRSLRERDELTQRDGEWRTRPGWDGGQVPLTVEGILAARIDALDEPQRDGLEVLSVIGRRADGELARAVKSDIDTVVPTLVGAGLLEPPVAPDYVLSFHHPLIQQVVYSRLVRRRRARLHARVGGAAEQLYGVDDASVDLFARHFYLGEEPAKAYPYLLRAAERAERLFANEQALTQLNRALELTDLVDASSEERLGLIRRCAKLEETVGHYDEALSLYREVAAAGDLHAAIGEIEVLRKVGQLGRDEAFALLERAREAHPDPAPTEVAALALEEGLLLRGRGEMHASIEALERGVAAVSGQHSSLEGELLLELGYSLELAGRHREGLLYASRAYEILQRAQDLPRLALALRVLGGIQCDLADAAGDREGLQQARETLEQAQALAHRVGNVEEQAAALINLAVVLGYLAEYEAALDVDRDALAAFESVGIVRGVACARCNIADHLNSLGRWDEALPAARKALEVARAIEMPMWITGALLSISVAELALGNPQPAVEAASEAADLALANGLPERARWAFHHESNAHEALGNHTRAEELRKQRDELTQD